MEPHAFWQQIEPATGDAAAGAVFRTSFPAMLPDGSILHLPIRPLDDGRHGLASLIINQASFAVQERLAAELAARLAADEPDIVVGLPTLGLTLAAAVARALGHPRYVPLGTSRKFWYDDGLSVPLSSVTTQAEKRLYIDPRLLPLLEGRRVALVDDVISSGTSMASGLRLLDGIGVAPVVLGVAMQQTDRWREKLAELDARWPDRVAGVFCSPLLVRDGDGWVVE
jgi:adenine/guanine phosphoribosyltransferase-like PRPP-binding protein